MLPPGPMTLVHCLERTNPSRRPIVPRLWRLEWQTAWIGSWLAAGVNLECQASSAAVNFSGHAMPLSSGLVPSARICRFAGSGPAFADTSLESGKPVAGCGR